MTDFSGIYPVMLTPFTADDKIDWEGYARLIDWYIEEGAQGLFAVCQSSEMLFLSLEERRALAEFTVRHVAGRVPVVASGHISDDIEAQKTELRTVADTGVDAVVFVTNHFAKPDAPESFLPVMQEVMTALPADLPLGLYECPAPWRRLLSDDEISWCAQSGRFTMLKDVSCDLETVKRRLSLTQGSPLSIINANAAYAWPIMQAGGRGFSGVMNNFHPDLYRWLQDHGAANPALAAEVDTLLVLAALAEPFGYPKLAKRFHVRRGTFGCEHSRAVPYDLPEKHWAIDAILDQVIAGADLARAKIKAQAKADVPA